MNRNKSRRRLRPGRDNILGDRDNSDSQERSGQKTQESVNGVVIQREIRLQAMQVSLAELELAVVCRAQVTIVREQHADAIWGRTNV